MCPYCDRVFKEVPSAKRHVQVSLKAGVCNPHPGGHAKAGQGKLTIPDEIKCMMCEKEWDTLEEYHEHVRDGDCFLERLIP